MANQIKHLKNLMLSRPYLTRIPDQSMIVDEQEENNDFVVATRDGRGAYALIYFPTGRTTILDLSNLNGDKFISYWYDPRTGNAFAGPSISPSHTMEILPPTSGQGHDWVLVIDDHSQKFGVPGITDR